MAITYRGQASRLNKIESKQNASGFQEKSDPGPRQGVGGEDPRDATAAYGQECLQKSVELVGEMFAKAGML